MSTFFRKARAAASGTFLVVILFSLNTFAHTARAKAPRKPKPAPTTNLEKKFFVNILRDQRAIWTSPFHLHGTDKKWLAPLGLSTLALIATDRHTSGELVEHGDNLNRLRISKDVSRIGSLSATGGLAGVLYLTGRVTHNNRLRETGLLGAEALIDSNLVVTALKTVLPFASTRSHQLF